MEADFKKARLITIVMILAVLGYGVVAWIISDGRGYGASSEAKMNFVRLMMFVFSATQITLAFAVRKTISAMSKTTSSARMLSLQITIDAFCEVIAIFGLVLVFMSKAFMDYVLFAVIALSAFAFFFPRRHDWESKSMGEKAGA